MIESDKQTSEARKHGGEALRLLNAAADVLNCDAAVDVPDAARALMAERDAVVAAHAAAARRYGEAVRDACADALTRRVIRDDMTLAMARSAIHDIDIDAAIAAAGGGA